MRQLESGQTRDVAISKTRLRRRLDPRVLRAMAVAVWIVLLLAVWLVTRASHAGPIEYLVNAVEALSHRPWAPAGILVLYLFRPLVLVPVTVLNLASGLLLGPVTGIGLAMAGTLLSATVGYGMGRFLGSAQMVENLSSRWSLVRSLRRRSFEAVVAGGLMYLHADAVNLPSGLLRVRFPTFLMGIVVGNSLTLSTAVIAGASVDGGLNDATLTIDFAYLAVAACLLTVSLVLAYLLRSRLGKTG